MGLRIMWHSNPFWGQSGYGTQSRHIIMRLKEMGHEVAFMPNTVYKLPVVNISGVRVYPIYDFDDGHDVVGAHLDNFRADILIGLYDIWVVPQEFHQYFDEPWVCLFPIDCTPVPNVVLERLATCDYPVVYSRFAAQRLVEAGVEGFHYIPHGIDTDVFKPGSKEEARVRLGWPQDVFVVSMVAANWGHPPTRKAFPENMLAFAEFHRRHPDSFLYMHTRMNPRQGRLDYGIFFGDLVSRLDLDEGSVKFANPHRMCLGLPDEYLAMVYQASDVLLAASMGEGFGLPIAEAQACGCPVVTTNFSSMVELTVNGIATEPLQPYWISLGAWQVMPSVDAIAEALETIYNWSEEEREENARRGVAFIKENYSFDVVMPKYWQPFLDRKVWTARRASS